jgi:O-antigen ligase
MPHARTAAIRNRISGRWLEAVRARRARFIALAVIMGLFLLTGGGSRFDVVSLAVLRPVAVLAIAYALTVGLWEQFAPLKTPLFLLVGLMVLIASQLIPIPATVWSHLPGREVYVHAAQVSGVDQAWRPTTLSAARSLNSLFALSVPLAALLLAGLQSRQYEEQVVWLVAALGLASAVWGVFQLLAPGSVLYFYSITNNGPVGFFANRNHQAVFLAAIVPFLVHLALENGARHKLGLIPILALGGAALMILVALVTGSRAGLLSLILSFAMSAVMVIGRWSGGPKGRRSARAGMAVAGGIAGLGIIVAILFLFGHGLAFERLYSTSTAEEGRYQVLPTLLVMVRDLFPVGGGFGSFDLIYYHYETLGVLSQYYLNHAHNDWLEILIEGGLATAALLLIALAWMLRRTLSVVRNSERGSRWSRQLAALTFVLILGLASFFDYPLRTPSIAAVFAVCCSLLAEREGQARRQGVRPTD